ncbi:MULTISPECIES: capsule biosynthesis protein [Alphaproteobacteria]|uniref:capsule biosynthesis protein n=1 Tax=Alphaproteobacteria TaxID=28211 RepID=UPI001F191EC4|nr:MULTISPECIES: capsular biosynthesis protein [Alphaproteobacteria]
MIEREGITDILYYADQLPYHAVAREVGQRLGARCHAMEFGYLRPDWITLERNGMGRLSHFPNDREVIAAIAEKLPAPDLHVLYPHTFGQEAFNEVVYNLTAYFGRPFFPLYRDDKYYSALVDYLPWVVRALHRKAYAPTDLYEKGHVPFHILALQLQSDYQIRANSPYQHLSEMLEEVIGSFARHAPSETFLVVKQHPLDNGLERWGRWVERIAHRHDVASRVIFIEQGNLAAMLKTALGVVVVNSTVGLHSLRARVPTMALGCAVFDIPGLTHQGSLDSFWARPEPVDKALLKCFIKALAATIQVKGNFYHQEGRKVAIAEIVRRLLSEQVNQPGAFADPPPRWSSPKANPRHIGNTGSR